MKIIHTYIPAGGSHLNKELIYCMTLSALLAKQNYLNITLYTNKEIGSLIKKIGIPYTKIDTTLLNDVNARVFSIPKLIVYSVQDEPFIHIDLDSFIFKPINFINIKNIYGTYKEGMDTMINFTKSDLVFYNTYIKNSFTIQPKLPIEFTEYVKFSEIPNMSIFGGHQFELIANASKYCLEIYEKEKEFFQTEYYNACIIEQLFVSSAIRMYVGYQEDIIESEKINFDFIFKKNPTVLEFIDEDKWEYPFKIHSNNDTLSIKNEYDLFKNASYNFGGFLHLGGYKNFDKIMFFIKTRILFDFLEGKRILKNINEHFGETTMADELHKKYLSYLSDKINIESKIM